MHRPLALGVLGACLSLASFAHAQPAPEPQPQPYPQPPAGYAQPGSPQPGYAQPGYAPGYPQPGYAPPAYYAPAIAPVQGPKKLDYDEGQPIPAGYHLRTGMRTGMVIGGGALLGAWWIVSILSGATLGAVDDANHKHTERSAILFVPVAGPWIGMSTLHPDSATATFGLGVLGVGQTLGAALLIAGIAIPKTELIRDDLGKAKLTLEPVLAFDHVGFKGTF
jgi:hypothetical protein